MRKKYQVMGRIDRIIREEIDAVSAFNDINKKNPLTPWDPSTKMDRMKPGNAARAEFTGGRDVKYHSYDDWLENYPWMSWKEYMETKLK